MSFLRISFWQLLVPRPHGRNRKEAVISFYHYSGLREYSVLLITFQKIKKTVWNSTLPSCDVIGRNIWRRTNLTLLLPKIRILFIHRMGNFKHIRFSDLVWNQCQTYFIMVLGLIALLFNEIFSCFSIANQSKK